MRWTAEGISSSFGKFLSETEMEALLTQAGAKPGDVVLIVAGPVKKAVQTTLGALRLEVAERLEIPREGIQPALDHRDAFL